MSGTPPVVLDELDRIGAVRTLNDARVLALESTGLVTLRPEGAGRWRILPAGRVGAVRIGDLDILVQPKVTIDRLLFLLGYAKDPGFRPQDVAGAAEPDLWRALAESLARQAERALAPGVLQGYVVIDEALPRVRGRIRIADQIARRPGLPLPIELRYDEYAADIAENQILRTALRRMAAVPGLPVPLRGRLTHLDGRLDGVRVLPNRTASPIWRPTRLNARYTPALRLAQIVRDNQSTEPGPGGITMAAFVVNMATVFEDFVTTALSEALAPYPGATRRQYPTHLDVGNTLPIRPDVVHLVGNRPLAVFDAKYKLEAPTSGYPNADAYQMLAYCTALNLPIGWLIYAHGTTHASQLQVRNTGIGIAYRSLSLAAPAADLLEQVNTVVAEAVRVARPISNQST